MGRLAETETTQPEDAYPLLEFLDDVRAGVWQDLASVTAVDGHRRALQRAYLRILEGRARFRGTASFRTFVFGVIRMTAREERRGWLRLLPMATSPDSLADTAPLPDAAACAAERRTRLVKALAQLSARQRETLELVFYHDMTIAEAAAVMAVRIGSARTHYERGKARLRALLPEEFRNG